MIVYIKPGCSKCAEAIELLEKNNCEYELRDYLTSPPTKEELQALLNKLGCKPLEIVRKTEKLFVEKFSDRERSDDEWIDIIAENPVLIERPIVIEGARAIIGRPPITILNILES